MAHDHGHAHAHDHISAAGKNQSRLLIVLVLAACFMVVEAVAGYLTNGLVLLADAGHMLADVVAMSLALLAIRFGRRPANARKTYGYYRLEILAALVNAMLLVAVCAYIFFETYRRFTSPQTVDSVPLLIVATLGLLVNVVSAMLLMAPSRSSMNMRGALLEVTSDLLSSAAAIVAGVILLVTGWRYADPIFAAGIGLFILPRTWTLLKSSLDVLLEGTPSEVSLPDIQRNLLALPGVGGLHDLHVWLITSGFIALSGHLVTGPGVDHEKLLVEATSLLHERFDIEHTTLQIESVDTAEALQQACLPDETACYLDPAAFATMVSQR